MDSLNQSTAAMQPQPQQNTNIVAISKVEYDAYQKGKQKERDMRNAREADIKRTTNFTAMGISADMAISSQNDAWLFLAKTQPNKLSDGQEIGKKIAELGFDDGHSFNFELITVPKITNVQYNIKSCLIKTNNNLGIPTTITVNNLNVMAVITAMGLKEGETYGTMTIKKSIIEDKVTSEKKDIFSVIITGDLLANFYVEREKHFATPQTPQQIKDAEKAEKAAKTPVTAAPEI
jgi:methionine-rich copper-binding protein CopC